MKSKFGIIIILAVAFIAIVFGIQNSGIVTIKLFLWKTTAPLAVIVFLSLIIGGGLTLITAKSFDLISNIVKNKKSGKESRPISKDLPRKEEDE